MMTLTPKLDDFQSGDLVMCEYYGDMRPMLIVRQIGRGVFDGSIFIMQEPHQNGERVKRLKWQFEHLLVRRYDVLMGIDLCASSRAGLL